MAAKEVFIIYLLFSYPLVDAYEAAVHAAKHKQARQAAAGKDADAKGSELAPLTQGSTKVCRHPQGCSADPDSHALLQGKIQAHLDSMDDQIDTTEAALPLLHFPFDGSMSNAGKLGGVIATGVGTTSFKPGVHGQALSLQGGHVELSKESGQYPAHDFTVAFWVKLSSTATKDVGLFDINYGASSDTTRAGGMALIMRPGGLKGCIMTSTRLTPFWRSGSACATYSGNLSPGVWTHLALVRRSAELSLYVNGAVVNSADVGRDAIRYDYAVYDDNSVNIGIWNIKGFDGTPMQGEIDDFRVYGAAVPIGPIFKVAKLPVGDCTEFASSSHYYGHNSKHGRGTVIRHEENGFVRVRFEDGSSGSYPLTDLNPCTLSIGDCTLFKKGARFYGHNNKHGKGTLMSNGNRVSVVFDDGAEGKYWKTELKLCTPSVGDCTKFAKGAQNYGHNSKHGSGTITGDEDNGFLAVRFEDSSTGRYARADLKLCRQLSVGDCTKFTKLSQYNGHNRKHGTGTIIGKLADGLVRLRFEDGEEGSYVLTDLLLCTDLSQRLSVGDCTKFKRGSQYHGHNSNHGKGTIISEEGGNKVTVHFEDRSSGSYNRNEFVPCSQLIVGDCAVVIAATYVGKHVWGTIKAEEADSKVSLRLHNGTESSYARKELELCPQFKIGDCTMFRKGSQHYGANTKHGRGFVTKVEGGTVTVQFEIWSGGSYPATDMEPCSGVKTFTECMAEKDCFDKFGKTESGWVKDCLLCPPNELKDEQCIKFRKCVRTNRATLSDRSTRLLKNIDIVTGQSPKDQVSVLVQADVSSESGRKCSDPSSPAFVRLLKAKCQCLHEFHDACDNAKDQQICLKTIACKHADVCDDWKKKTTSGDANCPGALMQGAPNRNNTPLPAAMLQSREAFKGLDESLTTKKTCR